jgi:AcrR family transcriptional regulator
MEQLGQSTRRPRAGRAPAQRPSQILDAAARVLLRDGLARATVDDIAADAGLGKGTVYEYFRSKTQIFTALRARYTDDTLAAGMAAMEQVPGAPAIQRIQRFIAGMFEFAAATADLLWPLFHDAGIQEQDELEPIKAALLDLVRAGVKSGELAVADPEFSVEFLLHGLHGVMEASLTRGQHNAQVLEQVDDILVALLSPAHP